MANGIAGKLSYLVAALCLSAALSQPTLAASEPLASTNTAPASGLAQSDSNSPSRVSDSVVDINSATASELSASLIGVGPSKAQAIVAYREQHGQFVSAEDLVKVKGIGQSTLQKNRSRITLN